jgi:hypothetical protein
MIEPVSSGLRRHWLWCGAWLAAVSMASPALSASRAWLIAGEADPRTPASRPETTALWVADILRSTPVAGNLQTIAADPVPVPGEVPSVPRPPAADHTLPLQPLARVFGQQGYNAATSRRPRVGPSVAGARADTLATTLDKAFLSLAPTDRGLLFYTGTIRLHPEDTAASALQLWDNTALTVRALERLSRRAPASTPLRFVVTQCHAGTFQRLVRPEARDVSTLGPSNSCVFTAEPVDHLGGACDSPRATPTLPDDIQPYASHFFAALAGRSRTGAPLRRSPDLDGDRSVTLHEAHLHAVIEGDSADLPRASSETYLERWQPLWLRYLDTSSEPDNLYGRVAMALAERLRLPLRGQPLLDALETRQQEMTTRLQRLAEESQRLDGDIERLQATLRRALAQRWPAAAHPHTAAYARFLAHDVGTAQAFLVAQTATYPTLVARQERQAQIARDQQALDRQLTQFDKLLRMRQLARLQRQFERHASTAARQEFGRLTRCEQTRP